MLHCHGDGFLNWIQKDALNNFFLGRSSCAFQGQLVGKLQVGGWKASTWEKCGNVCYKEKENCDMWTWNPSNENCALLKRYPPQYARMITRKSSSLLSGFKNCPGKDSSFVTNSKVNLC